MSRNSHDGARPIGGENIVRHPDGNFLPVDRIHHEGTEGGASFGFRKFRALKVGLRSAFLTIFFDRFLMGRGSQGRNQRVFGSQNDVGRTEKSIGACGVDSDFLS